MENQKKSNGHGGRRKGAGRKPKEQSIQLIEKLSPYDAVAMRELRKGVRNGSYKHLELFLSYRWGKPIQQNNINAEVDLFSMPIIDFFGNEDEEEDDKAT